MTDLAAAVPINLQDDFVRVVNNDNRQYIYSYGGKSCVIRPQGESFMPYECMVNNFGDPKAGLEERKDTIRGGTIPERSFELRRLAGRYGVYDGAPDKSIPEMIRERAPKFEFYSLANERIVTVVDDPEGQTNLGDINEGTPNDPKTLMALIQRQKQQIEYMEQALEAQRIGALTTAQAVPEDDPEAVVGSIQRARRARGSSITAERTPPPEPLEDLEPDPWVNRPPDDPPPDMGVPARVR